jgi:hypothetical protein
MTKAVLAAGAELIARARMAATAVQEVGLAAVGAAVQRVTTCPAL